MKKDTLLLLLGIVSVLGRKEDTKPDATCKKRS